MAPPPDLIDDAVAEILTRLPPDDPACLERAALVCKPWRRILSDPAFLRRRRAFHRIPPPLLGLFCNVACRSRFVPTTSFRLPRHNSIEHVVDCRHGLALLAASLTPSMGWDGPRVELLVWDPMDGGRRKLLGPGLFPFVSWNAAVLRAPGCDDDDRHGSAHFIVVFVGTDVQGCLTVTRACAYASESGVWRWPAFLRVGDYDVVRCGRQSVLVGEALYFLRVEGILQYDLAKHRLSAIDLPSGNENVALMEAEGGVLGVAGLSDSRLTLWRREVNPDDGGTGRWSKSRVIKLDTVTTLKPIFRRPLYNKPSLKMDFMIGADILSMGTRFGQYLIYLKSMRFEKIVDGNCTVHVYPYKSFYVPDCAKGELPSSAAAQQ